MPCLGKFLFVATFHSAVQGHHEPVKSSEHPYEDAVFPTNVDFG